MTTSPRCSLRSWTHSRRCTGFPCGTRVRHFVLFSSISGLLGSRWLAHYTATSTFLDTFAYARRNLGLPATVVNWGLWKSLADQEADAGQVMANAGLEPMPDEVAIARCRW